MPTKGVSKPRVAALVGPYMSGKTSLLESLLMVTDTIRKKGKAGHGDTVGDTSAEAKAREMGVELNIAEASYLGDEWTFLDCPGSVEFRQDAFNALMVADVAVVVVDPEPERAVMVQPLLRFLDERAIPHMIFINKVDHQAVRIRSVMEVLQSVSERPLVLREIPIREGEEITGYVDLVSERAYRYTPGQASQIISIPDSLRDREDAERQKLLEHLADFDDHLLEELLEDVTPPKEEVYGDLSKELAADLIVPVFFGAAEKDEGVRRLMKALRHDAPEPTATLARFSLQTDKGPCVQIFKTVHAEHTGKLSVGRVWGGEVQDGMAVRGEKVNGVFSIMGGETKKRTKSVLGQVVALGRLEKVRTGDLVGNGARAPKTPWPDPLPPLCAVSVTADKLGDDVKLSTAVARLCEEDPSLTMEQNHDTGQLLIWGQGDIHLQVALDRLRGRGHVDVTGIKPQVPYKETIRKSTTVQGRHKRQSGGHGQFGDVHLIIKPLARSEGLTFTDSIVGGVVPRQYIPAVERGVREYVARGPLGFPVVDVAVELVDGSYHAVDSSEMAFNTAAQMAMREGMPKCDPVLLEPILKVEISVPNSATAKAQRALSTRRGQILGFDRKDGWEGWDVVWGFLPQAEMHDLIIELRSQTMGVGTFSWTFDHLQELSGRLADQVVEQRRAEKK